MIFLVNLKIIMYNRNKFDFINIIQIKNNYKNKVKYNKEINFK